MTDPLSAVTGVAGVINLAGIVLGKCYAYGCAVANAPKEVQRLSEEVTTLSGILMGLQGLMTADTVTGTKWIALQASALACAKTLQEILDCLEIAASETKKNRLGAALSRLAWPLKQKETMVFVERLERQKLSLSVALNSSSAAAVQDVRSDVSEIRRGLEDATMDRRAEEMSAHKQRLLSWISKSNPEDINTKAYALHLPGTGKWLLATEEVQNLLNDDSCFLWLHGIPGSGKTVFASFIINHCILPRLSDQSIAAFFYCNFREPESLRAETVLGSLLCQLCKQRGYIPEELEEAFQHHSRDDGELSDISILELETALISMLSESHSTTLVVDGLDECHQREYLLTLLPKLSKRFTGNLKILATSRWETDIERHFGEFPQRSVQSHAADEDIHRCIVDEVNVNPKFQRLDNSLKDQIIISLSSNARGMFRLVQCQLDELAKLRTVKATKAALKSLPRDLHEMYERILYKIEDEDAILARRALMWLAFARRPLGLEELAEAAVFEAGTRHFDWDARLRDPEDILDILGCLVSLTATAEVVLAHNSVREYLVSKCEHPNAAAWHFPDADAEIAKLCLTYLLLDNFESGPCQDRVSMRERDQNYCLLRYAAQHWPMHAAMHLADDADLQRLAKQLMDPTRTVHFKAWTQVLLFGLCGPRNNNFLFRPGDPKATPLYYAASYGFEAHHCMQRTGAGTRTSSESYWKRERMSRSSTFVGRGLLTMIGEDPRIVGTAANARVQILEFGNRSVQGVPTCDAQDVTSVDPDDTAG
ncbi:MAG: hypothetical protein M1833_000895 [Piccolia ochrophora]|nr:MAG: hypothetical protein M1833_000895 [Piccolia ochrophora]